MFISIGEMLIVSGAGIQLKEAIAGTGSVDFTVVRKNAGLTEVASRCFTIRRTNSGVSRTALLERTMERWISALFSMLYRRCMAALTTKLLSKAGIANARVYVSGSNLLILTHYKGPDPEVSSNGNDTQGQGVEKNSVANGSTRTIGLTIGF